MRILAPGFGLLILSLTAAAASSSPLSAARELDCDAVNEGALNVALTGTERTSRAVALKAGESLDFVFETLTSGPLGSLTLVAGGGSPRPLLAGPTGTTVTFLAPARGTFGFEFATEGEEDGVFRVTCTRAGSSASRRAARLLAETPELRMLPDPEIPVYSVEPDAWASVRDGRLAAVTVQGTQGKSATGSLDVGQPTDDLDVWLQATGGKRYSLIAPGKAPPSGDAGAVGGGGLKYELMPQIMVGALVQFDQQGDPLMYGSRSLSDQGWMAGPVTTLQLTPGISLDARAAWGEPAASYSAADGPGGERHLVNARLAGTRTFGNWRFSPSVAVNYLEETRYSADSSMDGGLAPLTVESGRIDIRPEISYRLDVDGSTFIEPKAAISRFWDIDSLSRLAPGSFGDEAVRLKAEAGVTVGTATGTTLQATGGVEEGDTGAADIWSGRFKVSVPLK